MREGCDAELGGGVGDEADEFVGFGGGDGAGRNGVGGSVYGLPGGDAAGGGGDFDGRMFAGEEGFGEREFVGLECGWMRVVEDEGVVPLRGGEDLPVGGEAAGAEFEPVLADGVGEDERAAIDGDGLIEALRNARDEGEGELDGVAGFPGAIDAVEGVGRGGWLLLAVDVEGCVEIGRAHV